ncbi:Uncharacterised protein [Mycobacteroides abscessus subsp. abscessus]|nr:Uncharacterised protein [Mycobacteroides abscessus subsp. abscessus]
MSRGADAGLLAVSSPVAIGRSMVASGDRIVASAEGVSSGCPAMMAAPNATASWG